MKDLSLYVNIVVVSCLCMSIMVISATVFLCFIVKQFLLWFAYAVCFAVVVVPRVLIANL